MSEESVSVSWRRYDLNDPDQRVAGLDDATRSLAMGRCVVLPTDTVYGIAANPFSARAVQGLLNAKKRGRDMPPPVLIAEPEMLGALVATIPPAAAKLVRAHWPGALTVILKAQNSLTMDLGQSAGTIAVRVPDNETARDLLRHTGPLAVSSANISAQPAATSVDEAIAMLGDKVAVYLDGGTSRGLVASTIVDFASTETGRVVRAGAIDHAILLESAPELADSPVEPIQATGGVEDLKQSGATDADEAIVG